MNRTTLRTLCVAGFAVFAASCSQGSSTTNNGGSTPGGGAPSTGGATGSGGSTQTVNSGGTTAGSGGATQSGGNPVAGGTTTGAGGITTSAGGTTRSGGITTSSGGTTTSAGGTTTSSGGTTTAAGGTTHTGGEFAAGGVTTSSGGTTTSAGGTTTASGGTTTNAGGTTRAGGTTTSAGGTTTSAGGTTRSGGTTGSTGGATGGLDPNTIVPNLDGYMWIGTCSNGSASGLDCPLLPLTGSATCPNATSTDFNTQGLFRSVPFTVGGTAGTQYTINFEVRGILGTKCYSGGTMRTPALSSNPETNNDGWYLGGQPISSKWNTYEIHVSPAVTGSGATNPLVTGEDVYFMNAFPYPPVTYGLDTYCEAHETFPMKYTASIKVTGGGTITLTLHDSNCLGQQNCGSPDRQTTCANPRTMDLTGMSPQPTGFTQPYKQSNGFYPQWALFGNMTVTSP